MAITREKKSSKKIEKVETKKASKKSEAEDISIDWKGLETTAVAAIRGVKAAFGAGEVKFRSESTAHKRIRQAVRLALKEVG